MNCLTQPIAPKHGGAERFKILQPSYQHSHVRASTLLRTRTQPVCSMGWNKSFPSISEHKASCVSETLCGGLKEEEQALQKEAHHHHSPSSYSLHEKERGKGSKPLGGESLYPPNIAYPVSLLCHSNADCDEGWQTQASPGSRQDKGFIPISFPKACY